MGERTVVERYCDICGCVADGDRVDNITFYTCGHDICSNCSSGSVRNKTTQNWKECPICHKIGIGRKV